MQSVGSMADWVFDHVEFVFFIGLIGFGFYRDHVRRKTLHRRDDGVYVWVEWHGGERSACTDPTGGWDSEGDGDGGGD